MRARLPSRLALLTAAIVVVIIAGVTVWAMAGREPERRMDWSFAFVVPQSPSEVVVVFYPQDGIDDGDDPVVLPRRAAVSFERSKLTVTLYTDMPPARHQFAPFGTRCVRLELPRRTQATVIVDGHDGSRSTGDEPILEFLKQDPEQCRRIPVGDWPP